MQKVYFFLLTILLVSACSGTRKPSVQEQRALKQEQDSLALLQHEHSITYHDSLLSILELQRDSLLSFFDYTHHKDYEDAGHYVHKRLTVSRNLERCYISAEVSDKRELSLIAHYVGSYPIHANSIRVSVDSMETSERVHNHAYQTAEQYYERLTAEGESAVRLMHFLAMDNSRRFRIELTGDKSRYRFALTEDDRQALTETYRLYVILCDIDESMQHFTQHSTQAQKYRKRLKK